MLIKTAIGQDSHRFAIQHEICGTRNFTVPEPAPRPLLLGGVEFLGEPPLLGNSDADVVLHALCNAISGVTGVNILGAEADRLCFEEGIKDSAIYVKEALKYLEGASISHVSFSIECAKPAISPQIMDMRNSIAGIIGIDTSAVCITATSGEGLTDFGRGLGIQVLCVITVAYS